jgi:hypothetical protein
MLNADIETIRERRPRRRRPPLPERRDKLGNPAGAQLSPTPHGDQGTLPWLALWIVPLFVAMLLTVMIYLHQLVGL